jgi:hypothetical protein
MACGKQFIDSSRLQPTTLWQQYIEGKQTYQQLAARYNCSVKTIQRKIDAVETKRQTTFPSVVNVVMDTTYFGRKLGVMVFKDSISSQILYKQYVRQQTNRLYLSGIEEISRRGIKVQAITCDGRKGLMQLFDDIPVQMCQFHQIAIIRRYLTKKPKMEVSKELWEHVMLLTKTDRESFEGGLAAWHNKWESFLNERNKDASGKNRYVHKRLRSAYRSLKTNLPWLFTCYDTISLQIPNTTNAIDGHFADLKNKLRNHNGLSTERKKKFIDEFLKV